MNNESGPLRVDPTPDPDLKLDADGDFQVPTYEIAPEDKHIADAILAMDPLHEVPSPFMGFQNVKQPELTLSSLPPELRKSVQQQLAHVPIQKREGAEAALVRAALEHNSRVVRSRAGVGETALPFHKSLAEQATNHRQLDREFNSISEQLMEVDRYDMRFDAKTGERVPVPIYAVEGAARAKLVQRQADLSYRMKLLEGVEGQRQLAKALQETVELIKQRNAQLADEAEVQTRAEKLVRERRLDRRAEARARTLDPDAAR